MVRVAGLLDQVSRASTSAPPTAARRSRRSPRYASGVLELTAAQSKLWRDELVPGARRGGDRHRHGRRRDRGASSRSSRRRFGRQIYPVLTPLAVGPGQPFPYISGLSLSLGVTVRDPDSGEERFARVKVPETLPRFVAVGDARADDPARGRDLALPELGLPRHGARRARRLPGHARRRHRDLGRRGRPARGSRERAAQAPLRRGRPARGLELDLARDAGAADRAPGRPPRCRLPVPRPARPARDRCSSTTSTGPTSSTSRGCRRPSAGSRSRRTATSSPRSRRATSSCSTRTTRSRRASRRSSARRPRIRRSSTLKTTVYRTSHDSALAPALIEAAENGKQSVCIVELKARFDEQRNIEWARSLEQAGVHVVYGFPDLKIHAKTTLVIRREGDGLQRYVHIGTGNYHATTARIYEDVGLFTADPDIAADIADLFNYVTGFGRPRAFRKILVAPFNLRRELVERIRARRAPRRPPASTPRIRIKVNNLADPGDRRGALQGIAGRAPKIDLIVRAVCVLRPGRRGAERADPRPLDPRPLPRAQPPLLLRGGRRAELPARQRRSDAAQPRPPDRDGRAGRGAARARRDRDDLPPAAQRQPAGVDAGRPTARGRACSPRTASAGAPRSSSRCAAACARDGAARRRVLDGPTPTGGCGIMEPCPSASSTSGRTRSGSTSRATATELHREKAMLRLGEAIERYGRDPRRQARRDGGARRQLRREAREPRRRAGSRCSSTSPGRQAANGERAARAPRRAPRASRCGCSPREEEGRLGFLGAVVGDARAARGG